MDKHEFSARRRIWGGTMRGLMVLCAAVTCALAVFLIVYVLVKGVPNLSWQLLSTKPSYLDGSIGILPDIITTVCIGADHAAGGAAPGRLRRRVPDGVCRQQAGSGRYRVRRRDAVRHPLHYLRPGGP